MVTTCFAGSLRLQVPIRWQRIDRDFGVKEPLAPRVCRRNQQVIYLPPRAVAIAGVLAQGFLTASENPIVAAVQNAKTAP